MGASELVIRPQKEKYSLARIPPRLDGLHLA